MPASDSYEFDYTPGYVKGGHEYGTPYGDEFHAEVVEELLLSTVGYTQRGVTLAGGQGVLPTGTVLARHTASGLYFAYRPSATDGTQTPVGVLRDARDTGGPGYASISAFSSATGVTLAGGTQVFTGSPSGKVAANCLGNLVIRGTLNLNVMSGQDSSTVLVNGIGSGAGQAISLLGGRVINLGPAGGTAFPGGPMDGQPSGGNIMAFIF